MNRIVAILHNDASMNDNVHAIIKTFFDNNCTTEMYVFTDEPNETFNISNENMICKNVVWPSECDNVPKIRNWINTYFKANNFTGILHILEDNTTVLKDPTEFMLDLENIMDTFDYDVWFSTVCDKCNYLYAKYNPRLAIELDKPEYSKFNFSKKLLFTSHSNTQWIAYNFAKVPDDLLKFNEKFSIPMYYIIEFLARRRNTKKQNQLYYMNQYLTVPTEKDVFQTLNFDKQINPKTLQDEDAIFKDMKINYSSDNDIDSILETTYEILNSKLN